MSDFDDDFESESEEDFSASEDEWEPDNAEHSEAGEEDKSDDSNGRPHKSIFSPIRTRKKTHRQSLPGKDKGVNTKLAKKLSTTLRTSLLRKQSRLSQSIIIQSSKPTKNVAKTSIENSDSDSSGDEYLVNPDELDLKSSFFDVKPSTSSKIPSPLFDCNAGMDLSDSEKEDVDNGTEMKFMQLPSSSNMLTKINKVSTDQINLQHLHDYALNMENVRVQMLNRSASKDIKSENQTKVDVSSLLAMGEMNSNENCKSEFFKEEKKKSKKKRGHESDTDWEEVEEEKAETLPATKSVEFTVVQEQQQNRRKDKSTLDAEAVLKRKLNRMIKENQLNLHKVSLICHISNGFYCNKIINSPALMAAALKLLPNQSCYPKGRTEIKYFESIVKWFKTAIKLEYTGMYPNIKKRPPLPTSLALQMQYKHAICKRDYVLIFLAILRAMGIHCRLVKNLLPSAMRPSQNDLCKIKLKPDEEKSKNQKTKTAKGDKTTDNKSHKAKVKIETKVKSENTKQITKLDSKESSTDASPKKKMSQSNVETKTSRSSRKKVDTSKEHVEQPKRMTRAKNVSKSEALVITNEKTELKSKASRSQELKEKYLKKFNNKVEISIKKALNDNQKSTPEKIATMEKEVKTDTTKNKRKINLNVLQTSKKKPEPAKNAPTNMVDTQLKEQSKSITRSRSKTPTAIGNVKPEIIKIVGKSDVIAANTSVPYTRSQLKNRSTSPKVFVSTKFLQKDKNIQKNANTGNTIKKNPTPKHKNSHLTIPQLDGATDDIPRKRKPNLKKLSISKSSKKTAASDSEEEFEPSPPKKHKPKPKVVSEKNRKVLSSDEEEENPKQAIDVWVEVFSEFEDQWISINLFNGRVHCVDSIRRLSTSGQMSYVFAWNNDGSIKDVTARYCTQWNTVIRKHRVEQLWLDEMLQRHYGRKNSRDKAEDRELRKIHLDKPLPTAISEYKNNPLYALERHLLKFEAIYPPNALTLGYVRGEPVFARECVHTLHSREIWLKSARVVKPGEKPYKIVKARPKWDRHTSTVIKDLPLEIFGYWQTMDYDPPTAENGIVPRNCYGNVELFKMCMLPKKTVHLQLAGLNRVCKKLRIDCAPAVVGFDFHQGSCHPTYDGFVVCEEFEKQVVEAWNQDQEDQEKKEEEKYLSRVYGNWKKLYRGLMIRERLKIKYNFKGVTYEPPPKKSRSSKKK